MSKLLIIDKYKYIILSVILVLLFFALVTQFFETGKRTEGFSTNDDKPENVLYGNITYNPEEYQIKIFNNEYADINKKITFSYNNLYKLFKLSKNIYDMCQIIIFFYILSKDLYDMLDNNFVINYNIFLSLMTYDLSRKYFCSNI